MVTPAPAHGLAPCHTSNLLGHFKFQWSNVFNSIPPGLPVQGTSRRRCSDVWLRDQFNAARQLEKVPTGAVLLAPPDCRASFHALNSATDLANEQSKPAAASDPHRLAIPHPLKRPSTNHRLQREYALPTSSRRRLVTGYDPPGPVPFHNEATTADFHSAEAMQTPSRTHTHTSILPILCARVPPLAGL
eukprot:363643-Chlamydomonas_euryale.AAC.5